jgi:hypothetical protein
LSSKKVRLEDRLAAWGKDVLEYQNICSRRGDGRKFNSAGSVWILPDNRNAGPGSAPQDLFQGRNLSASDSKLAWNRQPLGNSDLSGVFC